MVYTTSKHTSFLLLLLLFFFIFYFYFFDFIFKLYNIVLVLPNIEMNPPQVYMCSPSWTLLPPSSLWVVPVYQPQASSIGKHTSNEVRLEVCNLLLAYYLSPHKWTPGQMSCNVGQ